MTPVAVVGGGPVGLVLALYLDHYSVPCTVLNDQPSTCDTPRGSTHNARTMEHYRRLGLAGEIRELGLPADHPTDVVYFTRYSGYELARLPMPSADGKRKAVRDAPDTDQVPEPLHRVNQMYVERLLLARVRSRPGIAVRFGTRVSGIRQDDTGVMVHTDSGDFRAAYVVGCDGSQSVVRAAIGTGYGGTGTVDQKILGRRATATHLRMPGLYRKYLSVRPAWSYWALNHELATNLISLNGDDEFFLLTSSADPAGVPALIHRATGADVDVEVLGHRSWTPGMALVADRFADRRVFLAGDAAHLFTPTGGFGMNTGIDDTANLAWKLAATLAGWAGPRLLESYEDERRPVAVRNTAAARQLNKNLGDLAPTPVLEEDSVAGEQERERVRALLSTYGEQFASLGVQLGARYDGSSVIVPDGDDPPPDSPVSYVASSVPGGRAPHAWCHRKREYGSSLFDFFGTGFTLLRLGFHAPEAKSIIAAAERAGVPLNVLTVGGDDIRELYQRDLVLIRPDQHVAWRGNAPPVDAEALFASVIGR